MNRQDLGDQFLTGKERGHIGQRHMEWFGLVGTNGRDSFECGFDLARLFVGFGAGRARGDGVALAGSKNLGLGHGRAQDRPQSGSSMRANP